jgi:hypothetical protein
MEIAESLIGKILREDSMNITEEKELSMEVLKNSTSIQLKPP